MNFASILDQYHDAFQNKYGSRLLPSHLRAINAVIRCRTPDAGQFARAMQRLRSYNFPTPFLWAS